MVNNKINKGDSWTPILNTLICNTSISDKAFRVLVFMLSKPTNWKFNKINIQKELNLSPKVLQRVLSELRKSKFISMKKTKSKEGVFNWIYKVSNSNIY